MALNYNSQQANTLIGTRSGTTLTGWELTSAYQSESGTQPTKSFATAGFSKASFGLFYTMGATETSNSLEVKIEQSTDKTNWVRIANDSTSTGTSTLTAREFTFVGTNAALATIDILLDIDYLYMRISAKETGVVTNVGTLFAEVTLGGQ
jgi:hypothetical protein